MDEVVRKVVALGVPGLVLSVVIATSGLAGGAALVAALATLGGPFGMAGGLVALGIMGAIADQIAKYGADRFTGSVVTGLLARGMTRDDVWRQVKRYPITKAAKRDVHRQLWPDRPVPTL